MATENDPQRFAPAQLTGGAGFTFEDRVTAFHLVALLDGVSMPALGGRVVTRVAVQQAAFGEPLDDVIVDAAGGIDHSTARLSLQVKRSITVSDAATNDDFRDVVQNSWRTLNKPGFRRDIDRYGAVVGRVAENSFVDFNLVCTLARESQSATTFADRFGEGRASQTQRAIVAAVRNIANAVADTPLSDEQVYLLFRHFVLIRMDMMHEGATTEATAIGSLQRALVQSDVDRAAVLWQSLCQFARDGDGNAAEYTRGALLPRLRAFRLLSAPSFAGDLAVLTEQTRSWLGRFQDKIGGVRVARTALRDILEEQRQAHRFTIINGLPGAGKTAVLHDYVAQAHARGSTLFLGANSVSGRTWLEHARALGLTSLRIDDLLVEIAASGSPILFIDGIDRIAPDNQGVIQDILHPILNNPHFADWRIVATARDSGIEPLRTWLPSPLLDGGVGYVGVNDLNDDEAEALAGSIPAMRHLLSAEDRRVRSLARRPFFAAVLAQGFSRAAYPAGFTPLSEIDLIDAWWRRGGYDARQDDVLQRQHALIELAQHSAADLGRNVQIRNLSAEGRAIFSALEADGIVQALRAGHSAQFAHDIFFEWAFFHFLVDQNDAWLNSLVSVGEPPALGRVVELLSQSMYRSQAEWSANLEAIRSATLRPQWLRAWLLGPIFTPYFTEQIAAFSATLAADNHKLLFKFLVWMQAEKSMPNPLVLAGVIGSADLDSTGRIKLADSLGWPSDTAAWMRILNWAIQNIESLPDGAIRHVVNLFQTWQCNWSGYQNPLSERILQRCLTWLQAIEVERNSWRRSRTVENGEPRIRVPSGVEAELRTIVLQGSRTYPAIATAYLDSVIAQARRNESTFGATMAFSPPLAQALPEKLAEYVRHALLEDLPDREYKKWSDGLDRQRRRRDEMNQLPPEERVQEDLFVESAPFPPSFSHLDLDRLSIGMDRSVFFPASPLREPFNSLLTDAPAIGLSLICDIANHAIEAWRQLHHHIRPSGTPLPLTIDFPWGVQEFWGDANQYTWFRGARGPKAVASAFMALEKWALGQIDAGQPVDSILESLIVGHESIAVLGIAIQVALKSRHVSPATLSLVSNQRLWRLDIGRSISEISFRSSSLIGFRPGDKPHVDAVQAANAIGTRGMSVRDLASLFALGSNDGLRDQCRAALARFPTELGFAYQEQMQDKEMIGNWTRTAKIYAACGDRDSYVVTPVQGRDDLVQLEVKAPEQAAPDTQEIIRRARAMERDLGLWNWVHETFEKNALKATISLDDAVARATEMLADYRAGLAGTMPVEEVMPHGAIAGTAAAVYCFAAESRHDEWAAEVISLYKAQGEPAEAELVYRSELPWHPKIFVAHALAARAGTPRGLSEDRHYLLQALSHPLMAVGIGALKGIGESWERDPRFSWIAFNLALQLCHHVRAEASDHGAMLEAQRQYRQQLIATSIATYATGTEYPSLFVPPLSWRRRTSDGNDDGHDDVEEQDHDERQWVRSEHVFYSSHAAEIIQAIPWQVVLDGAHRDAFVDMLALDVSWTLHQLNPAQKKKNEHVGDRHGEYEWEHSLCQILAKVTSKLPIEVVVERFLRPIFAQPDSICLDLLSTYIDMLVRVDVFDAQTLPPNALQILDACMDSAIESLRVRRGGHRDDPSTREAHSIIQSLLFVSVENAPGSSRYANGNWSEVGQVIPLIDKLIRRAGWTSTVMFYFARLCQRAVDHFPPTVFADLVLMQMQGGEFPASWQQTNIPANLAGLVQQFADRNHPLPAELARNLLQILDGLVDLGDRRSAALQTSESFRGVRLTSAAP